MVLKMMEKKTNI